MQHRNFPLFTITYESLHVFFIRNIFVRNMRLRLQVLLTANSGNIEENKKLNL